MVDVVSEELTALRDSARRVVGDLGLGARDERAADLVAELGWLLVATPEELGGLGMGLAGACALHLELGRGLAGVPFLSGVQVMAAVSRGELPERERWLERLGSGDTFAATSLAGSDFVLEEGGANPLLTGGAVALLDADRAAHALVRTRDDAFIALLPLDLPGVEITARPTWDETRRLFDLRATAVPVAPELVVARGAPARQLARTLDILRDFALAADATGGAAALLEQTVEYLRTRRQFGRPLALFQALKHRCADLQALCEGAGALLADSVERVGEPPWEGESLELADDAALRVKQFACATYMAVAEEALQLHGGIGMTSEHACHLYLKRAMLNEHLGRAGLCYDNAVAGRYLAAHP